MKRASVRDLRYRFSEVERLLGEGKKIEITKRKRVIARLVPVATANPRQRPDFLDRLRRLQTIYGRKGLRVSGARLLAEERDRY